MSKSDTITIDPALFREFAKAIVGRVFTKRVNTQAEADVLTRVNGRPYRIGDDYYTIVDSPLQVSRD